MKVLYALVAGLSAQVGVVLGVHDHWTAAGVCAYAGVVCALFSIQEAIEDAA